MIGDQEVCSSGFQWSLPHDRTMLSDYGTADTTATSFDENAFFLVSAQYIPATIPTNKSRDLQAHTLRRVPFRLTKQYQRPFKPSPPPSSPSPSH